MADGAEEFRRGTGRIGDGEIDVSVGSDVRGDGQPVWQVGRGLDDVIAPNRANPLHSKRVAVHRKQARSQWRIQYQKRIRAVNHPGGIAYDHTVTSLRARLKIRDRQYICVCADAGCIEKPLIGRRRRTGGGDRQIRGVSRVNSAAQWLRNYDRRKQQR